MELAKIQRRWNGTGLRLFHFAARSVAFSVGLFALFNIVGEWLRPGFDANGWWIDLRYLPGPLGAIVIATAALLLVAFALAPRQGDLRRRATRLATLVLLASCAWNAANFYRLWLAGAIHPGFGLSLSLPIAAAMWMVFRAAGCKALPRVRRRPVLLGLALAVLAVVFALGQMLCFGRTSYARPCDAVVVFGARAYADGTCSVALADRVRTGVELYHRGLASRLIFSGGPGDADVSEPQAMRRLAMSLGVPDEAILLDERGLDTNATVANTAEMFRREGIRRLLAVSHAYHLPRVKLTYERHGIEAYTVPARETYILRRTPQLMAREVLAFYAYYLRPMWS